MISFCSRGKDCAGCCSCLEQHEPALKPAFLVQLAKVRKITRGPKPARALRELGLKPDIAAQVPTTAGVIAALEPLAFSLEGRSFGVQLYGSEPNLPLIEFLHALRGGGHHRRALPLRGFD